MAKNTEHLSARTGHHPGELRGHPGVYHVSMTATGQLIVSSPIRRQLGMTTNWLRFVAVTEDEQGFVVLPIRPHRPRQVAR